MSTCTGFVKIRQVRGDALIPGRTFRNPKYPTGGKHLPVGKKLIICFKATIGEIKEDVSFIIADGEWYRAGFMQQLSNCRKTINLKFALYFKAPLVANDRHFARSAAGQEFGTIGADNDVLLMHDHSAGGIFDTGFYC